MKKVLLSLMIVASTLTGCASSDSVLLGQAHQKTSADSVKIYRNESKAPKQYEEIAIVTSSSDWGMSTSGSMALAIKGLKEKAASLGANGLILQPQDTRSDRDYWGDYNAVVSGVAIYVEQ